MVTKSELKKLNVDELRSTLQEHFEGITEDTTKADLRDLIDEHWDSFLEGAVNQPDPMDEIPEEDWVKSEDTFLKKDLYYGQRR